MTNESTLQEQLILEKLDADRKVEAMIRKDVAAVTENEGLKELITNMALKLYDLEVALRESEVHGGYTTAVLDGLTKVLLDRGLVDEKSLRAATQEAHDQFEAASKAAEEKYYQILDANTAQANPVDKVTTI